MKQSLYTQAQVWLAGSMIMAALNDFMGWLIMIVMSLIILLIAYKMKDTNADINDSIIDILKVDIKIFNNIIKRVEALEKPKRRRRK